MQECTKEEYKKLYDKYRDNFKIRQPQATEWVYPKRKVGEVIMLRRIGDQFFKAEEGWEELEPTITIGNVNKYLNRIEKEIKNAKPIETDLEELEGEPITEKPKKEKVKRKKRGRKKKRKVRSDKGKKRGSRNKKEVTNDRKNSNEKM